MGERYKAETVPSYIMVQVTLFFVEVIIGFATAKLELHPPSFS